MMLLNIITPMTRTENRVAIHDSIFQQENPGFIIKWYVIVDNTEEDSLCKEGLLPPHPLQSMCHKLIFFPSNGMGISGNIQRNRALECITSGYVYFLDDDNILHPDYLITMYDLINKNIGKTIITDQITKDGSYRLTAGPDKTKVCYIDTAQYTIPRIMIGDNRWSPFDYCADGNFIQEIYNRNQDKFVFINKPLCYYNYLR